MSVTNHTVAIVEYGCIAPALYNWKTREEAKTAIDKMLRSDEENAYIQRVTFRTIRMYSLIDDIDIAIDEEIYFDRKAISNAV